MDKLILGEAINEQIEFLSKDIGLSDVTEVMSEQETRINSIIDEYNKRNKISDILQTSAKNTEYARISVSHLDTLKAETPLLPKICEYELTEWNIYKANFESGEYVCEALTITHTIFPLLLKENENKMHITISKADKLHIQYQCIRKDSESFDVVVLYDDEVNVPIIKRFVMKEHEIAKVEIHFYQYFDDLRFNIVSSYWDDASFDTKLMQIDSSTKLRMKREIVIQIMDVPLSITEYKLPELSSIPVLMTDTVLDEQQYRSLWGVMIEHDDTRIATFTTISAIELQNYTYNVSYDAKLHYESYKDKLKHEFLILALVCQEAGYLSSHEGALATARELAYDDVSGLLVDTTQTIGTIANILNRVSQWTPSKMSLSFTSDLGIKTQPFSLIIESGKQNVKQFINNKKNDFDMAKSQSAASVGVVFKNDMKLKPNRTRYDVGMQILADRPKTRVIIEYEFVSQGNSDIITILNNPKENGTLLTIVENLASYGVQSQANLTYTVGGTYGLPIKLEHAINTLTIKRIVLIDKEATYHVSEIKDQDSVLSVAYMDQKFEIPLVNGTSTEVVFDDIGTAYGIGYIVNKSLQYTTVGDLVFIPASSTRRVLQHEASGYLVEGLIRWVDGNFSDTLSFQDTCVTNVKVQGSVGDYDLTFQSEFNIDRIIEHIDIKNTKIDYATVNNNTKVRTFKETTDDRTDFVFSLQCAVIALKASMSYKKQIAPTNVVNKIYSNEYTSKQDKINWQLRQDVNDLTTNLVNLAEKVDKIELEIEKLNRILSPPIYELLLREVASYAAGRVTTYVLGKILRQLTLQVGNLRRISTAVWSASVNASYAFRKGSKALYPKEQVALASSFVNTVARSVEKRHSLAKALRVDRPAYKHNNFAIQSIDPAEKTDVLIGYYMRGILNTSSNLSKIKPEFNVCKGSVPLPEFKVWYKPLNCIPKPVNVFVHELATNNEHTRRQLIYNRQRAGILKPSHSYATHENYSVLPNGEIEKELIFMGVGEFNTRGEIGGNIGGVHIKYRSLGLDRRNYVRAFRATNFNENGYTVEDVNRLFSSVFKQKNNVKYQKLTPEAKWQMLVASVDKRMQQDDLLYHTYVPDDSIGEVYKRLVDNPPEFKYNLFTNNCQSFTNALVEFQTKGVVPKEWPESLISTLYTPRVQFIDNKIDEAIDAIKKEVTRFRRNTVSPVVNTEQVYDQYGMYQRGEIDFMIYNGIHYYRGYSSEAKTIFDSDNED